MKDTPITWEIGQKGEGNWIPERALIIVKMPGGNIEIRFRDGEISLTGCQALVIQPRASNAIRVRLALPDWNE